MSEARESERERERELYAKDIMSAAWHTARRHSGNQHTADGKFACLFSIAGEGARLAPDNYS